jgi:Zn/Cd-binding protein ZinT
MRDIFGMEEGMEDKPEEMGTEYVYDSKGIRFLKYKGGNAGLRFSELKKLNSPHDSSSKFRSRVRIL